MANFELPVFVYGSLRRDQENYFLLRGKTVSEQPATMDRMGFYRFSGYPMMIDGGDCLVQGELMVISPQVYPRVLADLDRLEDYVLGDANSLYQRVQRIVKLADGSPVVAWTYLGNTRLLVERSPEKLPHGDWCRFLQEQA